MAGSGGRVWPHGPGVDRPAVAAHDGAGGRAGTAGFRSRPDPGAARTAEGTRPVIDLRPVLLVIGILLSVLAVAMLLPAIADAAVGNPDWQVFAVSAMLTLFVGLTLTLTCRGTADRFTLRQMVLLTSLSWLVIAVFAALPFAFSELKPTVDFTDAFFESMSGVTTTGATVLTGLDTVPPGILLWRALLQWLGGIGIIVMAIVILPNLSVGGMQLFRMESSDTSDKALPRTAQNAGSVSILYVVLTGLCAAAYWSAGMGGFDALCHAMTTIATGGYSTRDASMGHFEQPAVHWVAVLFMLVGALPFILYVRMVRGLQGGAARRDRTVLLRDGQVRWFLVIVLLAIALIVAYHPPATLAEVEPTLRHAVFNVLSVITGTGYATDDYGAWSGFALAVFFFLMFVGGCAGSTTCGIKIFRFQVLYETARVQILRLIQPSGVFIPYYNRRPIGDDVIASVMGFFFLFMLVFVLLAVALGLIGLDFITAVSGAATAIANVGPGLGDRIGPATTFADLPDAAKWLLSGAMLLGRLELSAVLVLLVPAFWQR